MPIPDLVQTLMSSGDMTRASHVSQILPHAIGVWAMEQYSGRTSAVSTIQQVAALPNLGKWTAVVHSLAWHAMFLLGASSASAGEALCGHMRGMSAGAASHCMHGVGHGVLLTGVATMFKGQHGNKTLNILDVILC